MLFSTESTLPSNPEHPHIFIINFNWGLKIIQLLKSFLATLIISEHLSSQKLTEVNRTQFGKENGEGQDGANEIAKIGHEPATAGPVSTDRGKW